ncbi:hypothetical protein [Streptomyces sp. AcH 505]
MEWIDPRYADLVKAMKQAAEQRRESGDARPVRGFVVPPKP